MKDFNIKITDKEVYINEKLQHFDCIMDKNDKKDDLNKKAILALTNAMGYESQFLFEEMSDRLNEIMIEYKNNNKDNGGNNMKKCEERWNNLPNIDNETVKIWLDNLLLDKDKMFIEELTAEEIRAEIEETKSSIDNFEIMGDKHAIIDCEEYLEVLEEMLKEKR